MAWPRQIAKAGKGENRMSFKGSVGHSYEEGKRRFIHDAVLVMLGRLDLGTETSHGYLQAIVDIAEDLHNMIEKKL